MYAPVAAPKIYFYNRRGLGDENMKCIVLMYSNLIIRIEDMVL